MSQRKVSLFDLTKERNDKTSGYGGEPALLPGWPGRRDSFHLVFIWRNSSPLAETEIGHVSKMRHVPIV